MIVCWKIIHDVYKAIFLVHGKNLRMAQRSGGEKYLNHRDHREHREKL